MTPWRCLIFCSYKKKYWHAVSSPFALWQYKKFDHVILCFCVLLLLKLKFWRQFSGHQRMWVSPFKNRVNCTLAQMHQKLLTLAKHTISLSFLINTLLFNFFPLLWSGGLFSLAVQFLALVCVKGLIGFLMCWLEGAHFQWAKCFCKIPEQVHTFCKPFCFFRALVTLLFIFYRQR